MTTARDQRRHDADLAEMPTVFACFLCYGAVFFDRLAPLYLITFVTRDLPVREGGVGILALAIGVGWALAMAVARWTSGRWSNRRRELVAATGAGLCGVASLAAPTWLVLCALRGLGGVAAGSAAPPVTALTFAASPNRRRGRIWASCRRRRASSAA